MFGAQTGKRNVIEAIAQVTVDEKKARDHGDDSSQPKKRRRKGNVGETAEGPAPKPSKARSRIMKKMSATSKGTR